MKKYLTLFLAAFFFNAGVLFAQTTSTVEVKGNCGMCKTRIEKAALKAGAEKATWDTKSKMLELVISKKDLKVEDIQKAIAEVGHDTGEFIATDEAYNALHSCCKYRDKK